MATGALGWQCHSHCVAELHASMPFESRIDLRPVLATSSSSTSPSSSSGAAFGGRFSHHRQENNSAPFSIVPAPWSSRRKNVLPCPHVELNSDSITAISVGVVGIALGIGIPLFYEVQFKGSESRGNTQPCFPCGGSGTQVCRFCVGAGDITLDLGFGEKEVSKCINCEGAGSITCTTCNGSGIQPRFMDRREFKDDD